MEPLSDYSKVTIATRTTDPESEGTTDYGAQIFELS